MLFTTTLSCRLKKTCLNISEEIKLARNALTQLQSCFSDIGKKINLNSIQDVLTKTAQMDFLKKKLANLKLATKLILLEK